MGVPCWELLLLVVSEKKWSSKNMRRPLFSKNYLHFGNYLLYLQRVIFDYHTIIKKLEKSVDDANFEIL